MEEEIEIEFKIMLTEEKFHLLEKKLPFPNQSIIQTNHYFDTKNFYLKEKQSSVRIREITGDYTFTLKQAKQNHVLESHKELNIKDAEALLREEPRQILEIEEILQPLDLSIDMLVYYGALKTERKYFSKDGYIYFLDKSFYKGMVDYEFELEAPTYEEGKVVFQHLLEKYQIEQSYPITKIARFFKTIE